MQDLEEAILDLKERVEDSGFNDGLVEEVARDWGLVPSLLERKFTERIGAAPSELDRTPSREARIRSCRATVVKLRRNFAQSALVIEDPEAPRGYRDIHGLAVRTPSRDEFVVIAVTGRDVLAVPVITVSKGNPISRLPIGMMFNGRDGLMKAIREGLAPEEPLWDFDGWLARHSDSADPDPS